MSVTQTLRNTSEKRAPLSILVTSRSRGTVIANDLTLSTHRMDYHIIFIDKMQVAPPQNSWLLLTTVGPQYLTFRNQKN